MGQFCALGIIRKRKTRGFEARGLTSNKPFTLSSPENQMDFLDHKLSELAGLVAPLDVITRREFKELLPRLEARFKGKPCKSRIDASEMDNADVQQWLLGLGITSDRVCVIWRSLEEGIAISSSDFFANFHEFFLPAVDDLWVFPAGLEWFLQLDHEEEFKYFSVVAAP